MQKKERKNDKLLPCRSFVYFLSSNDQNRWLVSRNSHITTMRDASHWLGSARQLLFCFALLLPKCALGDTHCHVNLTRDVGETLVLRPNVTEYLYPRVQNPAAIELQNFRSEVRLVCPGGEELTARGLPLGLGTAYLRCSGNDTFALAGQQLPVRFEEIGCTRASMPLARFRRVNCPPGMRCIQTGYQLNVFNFLPIMDVVYDPEAKTPIWSHAKIVATVHSQQTNSGMFTYRPGPVLQNDTFDLMDVYSAENQRRVLMSMDPRIISVNDIITNNELDTDYLVESPLISSHDLYYGTQQRSTYLQENLVPVWKSVHDGNWNYVASIVRKLASDLSTDLDVWSGVIVTPHQQPTPSAFGLPVQRDIYLGHDSRNRPVVPVPRLLFKYVYDRRGHRGLVFVVVNEPHRYSDRVLGPGYVVCRRQAVCENLYPDFVKPQMGYTYCCTIEDFMDTARSLALPVHPGTASIGGFSNDIVRRS
ncbi:hypothetical protein TKK_0009262 [Trichogramma kaykai]